MFCSWKVHLSLRREIPEEIFLTAIPVLITLMRALEAAS